MGGGAIAAAIAAAVWAYLAPGLASSERLRVVRLRAGLGPRILFLTDIHYHAGRGKERLIEALLECLRPDVVLLGGDTIDEFTPRPESVRGLLETIASHCRACYAVTGNHEHACIRMGRLSWRRLLAVFESSGCPMLLDQEAGLPGSGASVAGLMWRDDPREYSIPLSRIDAELVVSHSPDAFRHVPPGRRVVMLSGHTHGGQICLPGGRPIYTNSRYGYRSGLYRRGGSVLYVSRGIGEMMPPRLYCWREAVLLE